MVNKHRATLKARLAPLGRAAVDAFVGGAIGLTIATLWLHLMGWR